MPFLPLCGPNAARRENSGAAETIWKKRLTDHTGIPMGQLGQSSSTLIFRAGALGDFILTLPLLAACHATGRPLGLVAKPLFRNLLPGSVTLDFFADFESRECTALHSSDAVPELSSFPFFQGARILCFQRPDTVFEANVLSLGAESVRWINPRPDSPPHAARRFLEEAGFDSGALNLDRPTLHDDSPQGRDLWIHPGSGNKAKNASPERFAEYARTWKQKHDGDIVCSFGEADLELVKSVEDTFHACGIRFRSVIMPGLDELCRFLRLYAAEYVGNDSGVSHLAAACGIPVTVFFRCTDPEIWRPIGHCRVMRD
jgi:hypothetical protein